MTHSPPPSGVRAPAREYTGLIAVVAAAGLALTGCSGVLRRPRGARRTPAGTRGAWRGQVGRRRTGAAANRSAHRHVRRLRRLPPDSLRGKPVVVNFWYAGCAPCRAEARTSWRCATSTGTRPSSSA
ncbi:hypothetical protein QJS66_18970 [Kocuria rhizophila]|nr:hypothetical protein QJS66_18970 [Kocuria rhizophila]